MSYLSTHRQPSNRKKDETGQAVPHLPDTGAKPDADGSNVIPLPVISPPEIEPQTWQPPKEVIWMGHRQRVLAMSFAIPARLADSAAGSG